MVVTRRRIWFVEYRRIKLVQLLTLQYTILYLHILFNLKEIVDQNVVKQFFFSKRKYLEKHILLWLLLLDRQNMQYEIQKFNNLEGILEMK